MEVSWLAECVIKLIQWKYGTAVQLQDLQNLEYDPGGSFCKCCRVLTTYSNMVVILALSFAVVTASGQYVNNRVNPYTANSSDLYPTLGTSVFVDRDFPIDVSSERVFVLPITTKLSAFSMHGSFSKATEHAHISKSDNESASVSVNVTDMKYGVDSTIATYLLSSNDSQVPRFSNRTPHIIENDVDGTGYFGVLSIVLGLMILLTIVGERILFYYFYHYFLLPF